MSRHSISRRGGPGGNIRTLRGYARLRAQAFRLSGYGRISGRTKNIECGAIGIGAIQSRRIGFVVLGSHGFPAWRSRTEGPPPAVALIRRFVGNGISSYSAIASSLPLRPCATGIRDIDYTQSVWYRHYPNSLMWNNHGFPYGDRITNGVADTTSRPRRN